MRSKFNEIVFMAALFVASVCLMLIPLEPEITNYLLLFTQGLSALLLAVAIFMSSSLPPVREWALIVKQIFALLLIPVVAVSFYLTDYESVFITIWIAFSGFLCYELKWWNFNYFVIAFTAAGFVLSLLPIPSWISLVVYFSFTLVGAVVERKTTNRWNCFFVSTISLLWATSVAVAHLNAALPMIVPTLVIAFAHSGTLVHTLYRIKKQNDELEKRQQELSHIEERTLRQEIRPHFLLNVLSNVRVAYHENPAMGKKILGKLIEFETYTQQAFKKELIPIIQEVKLVQGVIDLFALERQVDVGLSLDLQDEKLMIPPFLLEPLVENSLQHSGILTQEGGMITIEEFEEFGLAHIIVSDNGKGHAAPSTSRGIGLSNVTFRVELLEQGSVDISSSEHGTAIHIAFAPKRI